MSRNEEFDLGQVVHDVTFSHGPWERTSKGTTYRGYSVEAWHPRFGVVGRMELDPPAEDGGREIHDIGAMFKGHGVGTAIYRYAQQQGLDPRHSSERTPDGDRWATKMGGNLPTNTRNPK